MRIIDTEIWLDMQEVETGCNLSYGSLKVMISRNSSNWQAIKDPEDQRRTLIRYKTLAAKYRRLLKEFYWSGLEPQEFIKQKPDCQSSLFSYVQEAYENYQTYLRFYSSESGADERKTRKIQKYLAKAASCMAAIHVYYCHHNLSVKNRKPLIELSEILKKQKKTLFPSPYGYMKTSVRHLQEALKLMDEGTPPDEIITRPRVGNENRMGKDHGFIKGAVARLLTTGKNPTIAEVARKIQYAATLEGFQKPSESTIRSYVAEMQSIIALERFGDSAKAAHRYRSSIKLARAMYAGDCWEMDGTRVQLQPFKNENTSSLGAYLYIVAVRDVYSGAFLGWSFSINESGQLYTDALKMAVSLEGYLPYELRYDRFPGHNSDNIERLFDGLKDKGVKLTKTSSATGKAHVERGFGTLQQVFESDRKEWVGQGIKSSRDYARPTPEYLQKVNKQLRAENFDFDAAWQLENEVLMTYNHCPLNIYSKKFKDIDQSPLQLLSSETERPNIIQIENYDIAELFWPTRQIKIRNFQINTEVNRTQYTYSLTDERYYHLVRRLDSVLLRFEPSDMSEVMLFHPMTGAFLDTVQQFEAIQLYGPDAQYDRLAEEKAKVKALRSRMKEEVQEIQSGCDVDVMAIQMSHLIPKENANEAESSAMARYLYNNPPLTPAPTAKTPQKKKKDKKAIEKEPDFVFAGDALKDILNQL